MGRIGRLCALSVAIVALALPACGEEQNEEVPAEVSSALARGPFVIRADRICSRGREKLILRGNRYFGDLPAGAEPRDAAVVVFARREAIPILRRQYARLRELTPPAGEERQIEAILDLADAGIDQLAADPILLRRGSGIPPALQRARIRAFRFGLGACGEPIERPVQGNGAGG